MESKWQEHRNDGLQVFVLMGEGFTAGMAADQEGLQSWVELGASYPILSDTLYQHSKAYFGRIALGSAMLLRPGVEVAVPRLAELEEIEPLE